MIILTEQLFCNYYTPIEHFSQYRTATYIINYVDSYFLTGDYTSLKWQISFESCMVLLLLRLLTTDSDITDQFTTCIDIMVVWKGATYIQ